MTVSIKQAMDELLETSIFREISNRNEPFAKKLVVWIIRYLLVISSMNESLQIDLERILFILHGKKYKKIFRITEKTFHKIEEEEKCDKYIR